MKTGCNTTCQECGQQAYGGRLGSWMVRDDIWAAAGYKPTDVACAKCLEDRLIKRFGIQAQGRGMVRHCAVIHAAAKCIKKLKNTVRCKCGADIQIQHLQRHVDSKACEQKANAIPDKYTRCEDGTIQHLMYYQTGKKRGEVRCVGLTFNKPTSISEIGAPLVNAYRTLHASKRKRLDAKKLVERFAEAQPAIVN